MSELCHIGPGLYEHEERLVKILKDKKGFLWLYKFILPNEQDGIEFPFSLHSTLYDKIEFVNHIAPSLMSTAFYWHTTFELINGKLPEFLKIERGEILGYTNPIIAQNLYGLNASNVKLGYDVLPPSDPRIGEVKEIYGLLQKIDLSEIPVRDHLAKKGISVSNNRSIEDVF